MMIYQGWCMVGVVVMTTGSRQMRPVAPPVRLQTVILTVIATQTVRRSSAQSHVFEYPTGYRLGEADCCVRILWAGDMSDDMDSSRPNTHDQVAKVCFPIFRSGRNPELMESDGAETRSFAKDQAGHADSSSFV